MQQKMPDNLSSWYRPGTLRARLLGPVSISVGDRVLADGDWPRRSARLLLLVLMTTPQHRLLRERIIDLLWPESTLEAGQNALRVALHALRRTLEPELRPGQPSAFVLSDGDSIGLVSGDGIRIDIDQFEAAAARSTSGADRTSSLREAVSIVSGELLAGEPNVDWCLSRREQLRRVFREIVLELAEIDRASASLETVPAMTLLLAMDPSDESIHRALMQSYLAAGERDEALRPYTRCVEALELELNVEPSAETQTLVAHIRQMAHEPMMPTLAGRRLEVLPVPPNLLIGRVRELERLEDMLLDPEVRLITLTGPGGIGKTRLALEAARRVADDFDDGVCFVDLSALVEPHLVVPTILHVLGVEEVAGATPVDVLVYLLRDLSLLLVLDNVEQVIAAADDIGVVLTSCAQVTVLATSRRPLQLRAEHLFTTPPLAVPSAGSGDRRERSPDTVQQRYESVSLFVERARASYPEFALTDTNMSAVVALCIRLDGLPLAIELAAARSRHLSPQELLLQIENRLPQLSSGARDLPERQRTLTSAIGWSYHLLEPSEQDMFRSLSVFVGSFGVEAAGRIGLLSPPGQAYVTETLWALADRSLLHIHHAGSGGATRYRMLETIRDYGLEQLESSTEIASVRRRHCEHFLALAESAELHFHGPEQVLWLERLQKDLDNLRSALGWACDAGEATMALRLSGALADFWRIKGHLTEGRTWLNRALTLADSEPSVGRAACLRGAGMLAHAQGDSDEALSRVDQALNDWTMLGDDRRAAQTMVLLADITKSRGDYDRATHLNERALAVFERLGFNPGVADTLNQLGIIANDLARYEHARELYERSGALFDSLGDHHGSARVLNNLGNLCFWQGAYEEAVTLFERSLLLWKELGDRPHSALVLANLGEALRAEGDIDKAIAITNEGLAVSREVGDRRSEATALYILGSLIQHHEFDRRAVEPLVASLELYFRLGDRLGMAWSLEALAGATSAIGQPGIAAQLLGAAESLREAVGVPLKPAEQDAYQRHYDATQRSLDSQELLDQLWLAGRLLPAADLLRLVKGMDSNYVIDSGSDPA